MTDTVYILPCMIDSGRCLILAANGRIENPNGSYRKYPSLWREIGQMNRDGRVVCLESGPQTRTEIRECEPLMAGTVFHVDNLRS